MRQPPKTDPTKTKLELPPTKDGWRYHLTEDDESLCKAYIEQFNLIDTHKRLSLPPFIKRKVIFSHVRLSENDRAPQLKLFDDNQFIIGDKGYSMARATHGINRGKWYYEVKIEEMPLGTAARIGWGRRYANLQAPLGYDKFGYSYRSRLGSKFHDSKGKTFDKDGGYGKGDVIGCMIFLPYGNPNEMTEIYHLPQSIKAAGNLLLAKKNTTGGLRILEEKEIQPDMTDPPISEGSKILFYKNGRLIGTAYENIYKGTYYPTISLYKNCKTSVNFGPHFKNPPEEASDDPDKDYFGYKDFQQVPDIEVVDNLLADIKYMLENEADCLEKLQMCIDNSKTSKN